MVKRDLALPAAEAPVVRKQSSGHSESAAVLTAGGFRPWWGWGEVSEVLKAHCVQAEEAQRRKGGGLPQRCPQTTCGQASQADCSTACELLLWVKGRGQGHRPKSDGELVKDRECSPETGGLYQLVMRLVEVTDKPTESGLNYEGI